MQVVGRHDEFAVSHVVHGVHDPADAHLRYSRISVDLIDDGVWPRDVAEHLQEGILERRMQCVHCFGRLAVRLNYGQLLIGALQSKVVLRNNASSLAFARTVGAVQN